MNILEKARKNYIDIKKREVEGLKQRILDFARDEFDESLLFVYDGCFNIKIPETDFELRPVFKKGEFQEYFTLTHEHAMYGTGYWSGLDKYEGLFSETKVRDWETLGKAYLDITKEN